MLLVTITACKRIVCNFGLDGRPNSIDSTEPLLQLVAIWHSKESPACEMVGSPIKDNHSECDTVCILGGTAPLLAMMVSLAITLRKAALEVVKKLSLGSRYRVNVLFDHNIISFLKPLLAQVDGDADVLIQTLIFLCYLTQGGNQGQERNIRSKYFAIANRRFA
uniref:Armadillo repeat-containing domain-containing protein n=1 Tax=Glossina palpalis gambiensis TaxID=67801 RepID=A0A1B0C0E0_9MUSC